jgi:hypothetical protein
MSEDAIGIVAAILVMKVAAVSAVEAGAVWTEKILSCNGSPCGRSFRPWLDRLPSTCEPTCGLCLGFWAVQRPTNPGPWGPEREVKWFLPFIGVVPGNIRMLFNLHSLTGGCEERRRTTTP